MHTTPSTDVKFAPIPPLVKDAVGVPNKKLEVADTNPAVVAGKSPMKSADAGLGKASAAHAAAQYVVSVDHPKGGAAAPHVAVKLEGSAPHVPHKGMDKGMDKGVPPMAKAADKTPVHK